MGFIGYFVKLIHIPMYVTPTSLPWTTIHIASRNNILVYVFSTNNLTVSLTVLKWRGVDGASIYIFIIVVVSSLCTRRELTLSTSISP